MPLNVAQLSDAFEQFNARYFESQLHISSIELKKHLPKCSMGHYDPELNQIQIREDLSNSEQRITLLHEMIHIRINGHGLKFQEELARCAENSCSSFREDILSENQRVKDFNHYGFMDPDDLFRSILLQLAIDHRGKSWTEMRQIVFQEINQSVSTPLDLSEFVQKEEELSAIWNSINNGSFHE
jgi:hypothetical protein